jgi:hypothetical protein
MNMLQNSSKKRDIYTVFWPQLLLSDSRLDIGLLSRPKVL